MDGDQKYFARLVGNCMPGLLHNLTLVLSWQPDPMPDALRLARAVLDAAWTQRIHTRGEEAFEMWLAASVADHYLALVREQSRSSEGTETVGLDDEAWAHVTEQDVQDSIAALDPKLRDLFKAQSAGSSYEELARKSGVGIVAVSHSLVEARRQLRERLLKLARSRRGGGTPSGESSTAPAPTRPPESPRPPDEDNP